jgi:hypothetical protein
MVFENKLDQITETPAFTVHQKQAAITMAEIEKSIIELIMEKMPVKIIFASLFYFWLRLEAPCDTRSPVKAVVRQSLS